MKYLSKIYDYIKIKINNCKEEKYSVKSLIIIFFVTAFIGWIWEILLELIINGNLVNKGTLIGPYLPIYGYGCIFTILLFTKTNIKNISNNIIKTFCVIVLIFTALEYFTSLYLEKVYGLRWWDYSNYSLNLNGRISLITSLFLGIAGCYGLYFYAPYINKKIMKISKNLLKIICSILVIIFFIDNVYCFKNPNSGEGITTVVIREINNIENMSKKFLI